MPAHLDLTLSSTHGNMLLSPRNGPGMTLRRVASYGSLEKGPQSSTSSRFSFNHLVQSPPPSPGLPALVPRHGKQTPTVTPRRVLRVLFWLFGTLTLLYFAFRQIQANSPLPNVGWSKQDDKVYEMIGEDVMPDHPTPLIVMDKRGRAQWTISIPSSYDFPLEPEVYSDVCRLTKETMEHVAELHAHKKKTYQAHYDYYHIDPYFIDVAEAVEHGMLPKPGMATLHGGFVTPGQDGNVVGELDRDLVEGEVCERSLTFVMETGNAGLGASLLMLWTAYGLAVKENRAFFVDDSRWAYGKYTTYFAPPPQPKCRPPPRHEILPCPRHARHLLVSAATSPWALGGAFTEHFENPRKMDVDRQQPIFDLARAGYEALYSLTEPDASYVESRVTEFQNKTESSGGETGLVIGIHVRHGDRHPMEFQYRDSYIPLNRYSDAARDLLYTTFNASGPDGGEDLAAEMHSLLVIASDDPNVYEAVEFSHSPRAQDLIRLAAKVDVEQTKPPTLRDLKPSGKPLQKEDLEMSMFKRFEEESVGWEGGFFSGMFWSLGKSESGAIVSQPDSVSKVEVSKESMRLRELVGRAYLMDMAVLGQSDKVVCAVSSVSCKVLAVMMGWDRAMGKDGEIGGWINVDGDFEWRGVSWR